MISRQQCYQKQHSMKTGHQNSVHEIAAKERTFLNLHDVQDLEDLHTSLCFTTYCLSSHLHHPS